MDAAAIGTDAQPPVGFVSALKRPAIRILAVSRASSKLAQATVSYGAMVYLATQGATQFQISLVAASTYLAALLFGFQGGTLSDSLSKRVAIVTGYIALASLCILVPVFFGTDVRQLMVIMFLSSALLQIVSPSLKSAVAIVATPAEVPTVSATVSIVGSIASATGSALLAPILIKLTDINTLLVISGAIYLFGAIRTYKLPAVESGKRISEAIKTVDWRPSALSMKTTARWIVDHGDLAGMILTGGIVVALFEAFNTLIPVYVRDVLDADPTNAVYIFAPAGIGFLIGTFLTPKLIGTMGARKLAILAAATLSLSMIAFGIVDVLAPFLAPLSPLTWLGSLFNFDVSEKVAAASLIAIPANFGSTAAGASVQAYINTRVPLERQGATFGLEEVQENALTLVLILALGIASTILGARAVMIVAPVIVIGIVLWLISYSFRIINDTELTSRAALRQLTDTPGPDQ